MPREPIQGIQGQDDDGEAPGVKAWNRYMQQVSENEQSDATEKAGREAAAAEEAAEEASRQGRGAFQSAAAAAAAGFKEMLTESPEARRMDVMAALQAEAFARLEIAPQAHADSVLAAQRTSEGPQSNPQGSLEAQDLARARRLEGIEKGRQPEELKKADAVRPAPAWVAPTKKPPVADNDPKQPKR